jgi:hypothetical protein
VTRRRSLLTAHGDAAKLAAERELLLATLRANGWSLTRTAEALGMCGASDVRRAIAHAGLSAEYIAHRTLGRPRKVGQARSASDTVTP